MKSESKIGIIVFASIVLALSIVYKSYNDYRADILIEEEINRHNKIIASYVEISNKIALKKRQLNEENYKLKEEIEKLREEVVKLKLLNNKEE